MAVLRIRIGIAVLIIPVRSVAVRPRVKISIFVVISVFPVGVLSPLLAPGDVEALNDGKHNDRTHDGTSSVTDKRKSHTGGGDHFHGSAHSQEDLHGKGTAKPQRSQSCKFIFHLEGDVHEHDKAAHVDEDQADRKETAQLFTDCRKHKILLHNRNHRRRTLVKARSKPAARTDSEKGLGHLVAVSGVRSKRILPDLNTDAHMAEKEIGSHGSDNSRRNTKEEIPPISGTHIKHDKVRHKEDQRTSQVLGDHEDQHMGSGDGRRDDHMLKVGRFRQKACHRKDKDDLYKLRRLERKAADAQGQLGTVAELCKNQHHAQKADTAQRVNIAQFIQKFQLFDQDRNDQGRHRGDRQDLELLHRLVVRDTGQHDKADRDQHAHVVDQKLRSPGVKIPEKHQHRSQIDRLGSVKIKERGLIHLQVKHREGDKMNGEHQNILSQEQKFPRVLILFFENDIALQRVKSDEHQQNILRNVNNQFCHDFSTPLPV